MDRVLMYTDGSSSPKDKTGGFGVIIMYKGREKIVTGREEGTTNQRMELMAVIAGLAALRRRRRWGVTVYSDSAYVVNCFHQEWILNWRRNGWRNYRGKPVANRELWETLEALVALHDVEFVHVKGHAGHELNERVDEIASKARRQVA